MGDSVKMTFGADGEVTSSQGLEGHGVRNFDSRPKDSDTPATPSVVGKTGGITTRWNAGNPDVIETSRPTKATVRTGARVDGVSARNQAGSPITLDQAGPSDVVTLPNGISTNAGTMLNLGYISKHPSGTGYVVNPAMVPELQETMEKQEVAAEAAVANDGSEIDATGIPGTTTATDLVMNNLKRDLPAATHTAAMQSMISTGDIPEGMLQDMAQMTRTSPEEVRALARSAFAEYQNTAKSVAAKAGVPSHAFSDLIEWIGENHRDAGMRAFLDLTEKHEITGVARLARAYSRVGRAETAFSTEDVMNAQYGRGISPVLVDGKAMLNIQGRGVMSLRDAQRAGYIKLTKLS